MRRSIALRRLGGLVMLVAVVGCQQAHMAVDADDPLVGAFIELMMPRRIEVQRYLTQPVSLAGDGQPDGLEMILAAQDAVGDPVKVVGTFHFELYTRRMASADKLGTRVAFWPVTIDSEESFVQYWDAFSRFYKFRLALEQPPLPAGRYVVTARLLGPTGLKLYDEYEFEYDGGAVPSIATTY